MGYIAVHKDTKQVLCPNTWEATYCGWVFETVEELEDYARNIDIQLNNYIIHSVSEDIYEFKLQIEKI